VVFGEAAVTYVKTEYGVLSTKFFCLRTKKISPAHPVNELELKHVMDMGDNIYE
jgi:hypothetical protein